MLVRAYLERERVSDASRSVETMISETPLKQSKKYKQNNKQHIFNLKAALDPDSHICIEQLTGR